MIIDSHTHIFPPDVINNRSDYASRDAGFAALYANPGAKMYTAENLIEEMDKAGVAKAVTLNITWQTPYLCCLTNDYLVNSAARYSDRLIPFISLPGFGTPAALAEIERCQPGGIRGIGELRPNYGDAPFNERVLSWLAGILKTRKLVLLVHASEPVGHIYPGKGFSTPAVLEKFIARLPGVNIICAHWGGGLPFYNMMPEVQKILACVYYDSAASPFLYTPAVYEVVAALAGRDHILFGSDCPLISQRRQLSEISSLAMSDTHRSLLLGGNAAKLLGIEDGKS